MARKIEVSLLNKKEISLLRNFVTTEHIHFKDCRDACMFSLLFYSGLKTHELGELDKKDYDFKKKSIVVKGRFVNLNPMEIKVLNHYLTFRKDHYKPLFISLRNYDLIQIIQTLDANNIRAIDKRNRILKMLGTSDIRLTDRSVQRSAKSLFRELGITKNIKPKDFRHLLGIRLFSFGATHQSIDEIMGNTAPWVKTHYKKLSLKISKRG